MLYWYFVFFVHFDPNAHTSESGADPSGSGSIANVCLYKCGRSRMFIPDSVSELFSSRIPDPYFFHPGSASNNLSILTQKLVSKP